MSRKYECEVCRVAVEQGTESTEMCAILQTRYEKADALNDWAKMWGCVHCCHCLKEKEDRERTS